MAFDGVLTPEIRELCRAGLDFLTPWHTRTPPKTPPAPISVSGTAGPAACGETGMVGPDSEPLDRRALGRGRNSVSANRPSTCTPLVRRATAPGEAGTVEAGAALLSAGEPAYPM